MIERLTAHEAARIDKYIADNAEEISRSFAARLCEEGRVTVNGRTADKKHKLKGGEEIEIDIPEPETVEVVAEDIPLDIVYEDEDVIVINKPQGMCVHPAPGN